MKNLFKFSAMMIVFSWGTNYAKSQDCSVNLNQATSKMVDGSFSPGINGMSPAYLRQSGSNVVVDVINNETGELLAAQHTIVSYNLSNVEDRIVSGDFDWDGSKDDIAIFYQTGPSSCRIDILEGENDGSFTMHYSRWTSYGYNVDLIKGRLVSGEFNHADHFWDLAAFYDYGGGQTRIHVWTLSANFNVSYSGSTGWWSTYGYTASKITDRVVSGDFDGDDYWDDIAAFYDYGNGQTRIHVWLSDNTHFTYQGANGWYTFPYGYYPNNISKRVVAGDFNRDGECDEICAFYDYGGGETRAHVWRGRSNSAPAWHNNYFEYQGNSGWWSVPSGYTASKINYKVAMAYDGGGITGKFSDIIALYNYGSSTSKYHFFDSNGSSFSYSHKSFCKAPQFFDDIEVQGVTTDNQEELIGESESASTDELQDIEEITVFPNPTTGAIQIVLNQKFSSGIITVRILDISGRIIQENSSLVGGGLQLKVDLSSIPQGIYLLELINEKGEREVVKVTKR